MELLLLIILALIAAAFYAGVQCGHKIGPMPKVIERIKSSLS